MRFYTAQELYDYSIVPKVREIMEILSISFDNSLLLLRHYKWNIEKLTEIYWNKK